MWWECDECGTRTEALERPYHCDECGTAGPVFSRLTAGEGPDNDLTERRSLWFYLGGGFIGHVGAAYGRT